MLVFWLEYPLMHIAPLISRFSKTTNEETIVVTEYGIPDWRLKMGFETPSFGLAKVFVSPSKEEIARIVRSSSGSNAKHIFHGLSNYPNNYSALKALYKEKCLVGLHLEPMPSSGSLKAYGRALFYRFISYYWGARVGFLLTHGKLGLDHYSKTGFPIEKIFEFGYFGCIQDCDNDKAYTEIGKNDNSRLKILYVGQLIERKNVSFLLIVLSDLAKYNVDWELSIVGDGPQKEELLKIAKDLQVSDRIKFEGVISAIAIKKYYEESDLLVLPSLFEPWGAVTIEALSAGLPVIVSRNCGSSVAAFGDLGISFEVGDKSSLSNAIIEIARKRCLEDVTTRNSRKKMVRNLFSEEAGADYLKEIFQYLQGSGTRPSPPWRRNET